MDEEVGNAQDAAIELMGAIHEHDTKALVKLTPEERKAQLQARTVLYNYVDKIWEDAKAAGLNPAIRDDWSGVAGLRDLTNELVSNVYEAVGDPDD